MVLVENASVGVRVHWTGWELMVELEDDKDEKEYDIGCCFIHFCANE
jgi:hypothetical protein